MWRERRTEDRGQRTENRGHGCEESRTAGRRECDDDESVAMGEEYGCEYGEESVAAAVWLDGRECGRDRQGEQGETRIARRAEY